MKVAVVLLAGAATWALVIAGLYAWVNSVGFLAVAGTFALVAVLLSNFVPRP